MQSFLAIVEKHKNELLQIPGVISVGVGHKLKGGKKSKQLSIIVGVVKKLPRESIPAGHLIPALIDGAPTDVIEVGRLRLI